jgi:hypothetical protein
MLIALRVFVLIALRMHVLITRSGSVVRVLVSSGGSTVARDNNVDRSSLLGDGGSGSIDG